MLTSVILMGVLLLFAAYILFSIESLLCRLIDVLFSTFQVFAGVDTIMYKGSENYLVNVFFSNDVVTAVYWGMACIGFALVFGFAIAALIRKGFDSTGEKVKATYGQILTNVFKAILLILLMTAIVSATINATGILMQSVDDLFNQAEDIANPSSIVFDDVDMATMFRIVNTIGNYSLNPSYDSRFNINSCFNAISADMQMLADANAFKFSYEGAEDSWQYSLLKIYNSASIYQDLDIDVYNESVITAITDCMYQIKTNKNFKPLQSYEMEYTTRNLGAQLGRTILLSCSFDSALNDKYNEDASVMDNLRLPYYTGEKNIYSRSQVEEDFDIGIFSWNHIVGIAVSFFVIKEMATILINCVARIFNIILLYVTAPGFIAVMPLDDGGKFKQWITAFVIQSLSIFGSIFAVRLLMIFVPIVLSPSLILFENSSYNAIAKLVFVVGVCVTSEKANGLISGILADNAGYQSIMAGDVGGGMVNRALSMGGRLASGAAKMGFSAGTSVLGGLGTATGLSTAGDKLKSSLKNMGQSMRDKGGLRSAWKSGWATTEGENKDKEKAEKDAEKRDAKEFRNFVTDALSSMSGVQPGGGPVSSGIANATQPANNNNNNNNNNNVQPASSIPQGGGIQAMVPPPQQPQNHGVNNN